MSIYRDIDRIYGHFKNNKIYQIITCPYIRSMTLGALRLSNYKSIERHGLGIFVTYIYNKFQLLINKF